MNEHRIILRAEWGASSHSLPSTPMRLPATRVVCHHSVTGITPDPHLDMRAIEKVGLGKYKQFSYSYVIHPRDGEILEGCGLKRGAHTGGQNSTTFGICWAGDYTDRAPKVQQIDSTRWLIHELVERGLLVPGADIIGHRNAIDPDTGKPFATACPGNKLYALLDDIRRPWTETAPVAPTPTPPAVTDDWTEEALMALPTLARGAKGQHVKILQGLLLVAAGDLLDEGDLDGDFGPKTEGALRTWQDRTGRLSADGVCGPATWRWLIGA